MEPLLGIRARLLSKGAGRWAESGGENAKFGLSTVELLAAVEMLRKENLVDTRRSAQMVYYRISNQDATAIMETLYQQFCAVGKR